MTTTVTEPKPRADRSVAETRLRRVRTREAAWKIIREKYRPEYERLGAMYKRTVSAEDVNSSEHWRNVVWSRAKTKLTERHYDEFIEIRDRLRAEYDAKNPEIAARIEARRNGNNAPAAPPKLRVSQVASEKVDDMIDSNYDFIMRLRNGKNTRSR